jgi:LuxR family maltose regulon positive regulatory protein
MGADAARALPLDGPAGALALLLHGVARHLTGDRDRARRPLEDAGRAARRSAPAVAALARAQLALLAFERADADAATHHADAADAILADGPAPDAARALVLAVGAVAAAERGEVAQARHDARDAHGLLAAPGAESTWLVVEGLTWLARAHLQLSDGPVARALLARAARAVGRVHDAPVLDSWVHDGWERADAFAASATGAGPTLTTAELRVLRLLPSHLSFREIGDRLHVSPNTIKTHALAAYRKLDVSCRSDAVARGRSAGLIHG